MNVVQCSEVQCYVVQYGEVWCSAVWCSEVWTVATLAYSDHRAVIQKLMAGQKGEGQECEEGKK